MRVASILLLPLLAGCLRETCKPGTDPTLEIGTGERGFQPLGHDPTMEIVHGPQGGYHAAIALDATYLDASDLMLGVFEGTVDGEVVGHTEPWLQMRCNPRTASLQAWNALLVWDAEPEELHGKAATVDVTVRDTRGVEVSDSVDVRLHDPNLE